MVSCGCKDWGMTANMDKVIALDVALLEPEEPSVATAVMT